MKLFKTLTLISLSSLTLAASAQNNGKIAGNIQDGTDHKPVESATISLLKAQDSALVKTSLSGKEGTFLLQNVKPGSYLLMISSSGHKKAFKGPFQLTGDSLSLGTLSLITDGKTLKEVTVVSKRPLIEHKIDKTIVNVDASIQNVGSTALEVLETAPGVTVDKDGKVSLRGKDGVNILIDGKPSYVSGQELANLLKSMPSSSLDQIEIMTNPSAKYDAAGNAGIINIKTKKNKAKGMNGTVSTTYLQGKGWRENSSANLNYRNGKINLFGNYSYFFHDGYQDLNIIKNFRNTSTHQLEAVFDQYSTMENRAHTHSIKAGLDLYATKNTTYGLVFTGMINPGVNQGLNTALLKNNNNRVDSIVNSTNYQKDRSTNTGINLNYHHTFDTTGRDVSADIDYVNYNVAAHQMFTSEYLNADGTTKKPSTLLRGSLPSDISIYSAKLDFTLPLNKSTKFETGVKSSYVTTDNDAQYENSISTGWKTDNTKSNHFIYKENINAAYVNFSTHFKKTDVQAGLRAENTNAKGDQLGNAVTAGSSFDRSYTGLFPTFFISQEINKNNTISLNYGRRIDRPDYQDLNPFYYFLDEYTYQVGNTALNPQYTHSVELSHSYKGFLNTTLNYSKTNDMFAEVFDQVTSERKTFVTKGNIATRREFGLSVSANMPVTKFWSTNIYTNVANTKFSGALLGSNLNVDATVFMGNLSNQFKFKKGWGADVSGFYRSKGLEGELVAGSMWQVSAGISKQVLKDKGTIKLGLKDVFRSQIFHGSINYKDIDASFTNNNYRQMGSVSFSYRFGKPIKGSQKRKTGGASEEQGRIKNQNG